VARLLYDPAQRWPAQPADAPAPRPDTLRAGRWPDGSTSRTGWWTWSRIAEKAT